MEYEIKKDFVDLEEFIKNYSLSDIAGNIEMLDKLKPMHKKLYSMMTFIIEIEMQNKAIKLLNADSLNYFKESVSDLGQVLFCWIHGAYKPANLILRSGIETFIRATSGNGNRLVFSEKSVYKMFDMAKETQFYKSNLAKDIFEKLYSEYKDLCQIVHTSGISNMAHLSALKTFPLFSTKESQNISITFNKVCSLMLIVIYSNYYKFIHMMHHKNQKNFLDSIPASIKGKVNSNII